MFAHSMKDWIRTERKFTNQAFGEWRKKWDDAIATSALRIRNQVTQHLITGGLKDPGPGKGGSKGVRQKSGEETEKSSDAKMASPIDEETRARRLALKSALVIQVNHNASSLGSRDD